MKKVIGVLLLINLLLLFVIMALLKNSVEKEEYEVKIETDSAVELMKVFLPRGEFKDSRMIDATCVQENAQKTLEIPLRESYEIRIKKGENCKAGDVIAEADGTEIKLETDSRILDYTKSENTLTIQYLDYREMWLEAYVSVNVYQNLNYESDLQVMLEGESYNGNIVWLDWQVNNGLVLVKIQTDADILPGTEVQVAIINRIYEDVVYIANNYIMEDNIGEYLYYKEDDPDSKAEKVYLEIIYKGEKYSVIEIDEEYVNGWMYTEYSY